MKKLSCVFLFVIYIKANLYAQQVMPEVICAGSGSLKNSSVNMDYVIGETVIATMKSSNNQLSSGFEQSTYTITAVKDNITEIQVSLFPNPIKNNLILQSKDVHLKNGKYQLTDMNGKLIMEGNVANENTIIDCSSFATATYYLMLMNEKNQLLHSYKIVKQ
ncbi:MAG: T9SS type A sorting domain-containing protein [Chitinophagales bacterium]